MELLLKLMGNTFILFPLFALIPTLLFILLYVKTKSKLQLTTALLWFIYMIYESSMYLRILCSGECNIRIDLLLIYPLLLILSSVSLLYFIFKQFKN